MGDYGFGLLQTAGSGAGSAGGTGLFGGGGAFRSSQQFSSSAGSALFLPGYPQVMQDELLLGVSCAPGKLSSKSSLQQDKHKRKDFSPQESSAAAYREELSKPGELSHRQGSPEPLGVEGPDKLLPASPSSSSSSSSSSSCSAEEVAATTTTAGDTHVSGSPPSLGGHQLPAKNKLQMDGHLLSGGTNLLGSPFPGSPDLPNTQSPGGSISSPSLPGFGTPWSVQTSSPPPPPPSQIPQQQPAAPHPAGHNLNALQSPEPDSYYPGIPSSINPAFFHSFSPVSANPCPGMNVPGFSSPFSAQINISQQQQSRRSPVSPQLNPQHHQAAAFLQQRNNYNHHQPMVKQSPWSSTPRQRPEHRQHVLGRDARRDRRTVTWNPGTMNQISPLRSTLSGKSSPLLNSTRSTPSLTPNLGLMTIFQTTTTSNSLLPLQVRMDRSRMYDSLNMHSLENSLIEIMRAEHDPLKGRLNYPHPGTDSLLMLNARSYGRRRGNSSISLLLKLK
ncbi:hypothetical protein GDO81_000187 [Engystomops pustulosus]|uniref:Uncharacterized protein n=1 Tax=Engystomops pustulosus TaxID=76066 RepID=A0AAV7D3E9_ENGPU|nr:hypothetical protein GDO81_000187 [Engystomops pustulosus]